MLPFYLHIMPILTYIPYILQNIATMDFYFNFNSKNLILIPLQTWRINCTSSSLALMEKVIVPESLCKTI